jgi:anaerobic magnesium-protoporphyrin IX monomethyl ester cyclase
MPLLGINVSILSPDPGTLEFNRARKLNSEFQYVSQGRNGNLRLIPDTDRFGQSIPIGLPSVCNHVSKKDLNDLVRLIEGEFYLRTDIQSRLRSNLYPDQLQIVEEFLAYQRHQVTQLHTSMLSGSLHHLIARRIHSSEHTPT